ncbi:hypothetical protein [Carboxylicivirga sp. N1Y90]|uniref:hypothetical protein n=1 Tax=Carboxylicivirga fragile TaxID=3417571 RepID=UPI003D353022|nr:hypothetical protein [Marinilabiliaceae bacterium N1Y90]
MKLNQKITPYQQLITLIENETTGSAKELSNFIGISRATLFTMLDEIRGMGVGIKYDEEINSYIYTNGKRIKVNKPIEVIET